MHPLLFIAGSLLAWLAPVLGVLALASPIGFMLAGAGIVLGLIWLLAAIILLMAIRT